METGQIKEIILEQRERALNRKNLVPREGILSLGELLSVPHVVAVTGIRRCGKSSLLALWARQLIQERTASPPQVWYLNFEDERFIGYPSQELNRILEAFLELYPAGPGKKYLFFDEVQNIPQWEKFIGRLYDSGEYKIFVTGSNSALLSREIGTALTGRSLSVVLYPFSFREVLRYRNLAIPGRGSLGTKERALVKRQCEEYLRGGGFPGRLDPARGVEILGELYQNILFRDIIVRFAIKNAKEFREFSRFVVSNICGLHSYASLHRALPGIKSATSIKDYVSFLESAYLCFTLPMFSPSLKVQARNPFKVYCIDNGIYGEVGFGVSENLGKLYENLVFLGLRRQPGELFYFKGLGEVDFVRCQKGQYELYQVAYDLAQEKTREREERALLEAMGSFALKEAWIITREKEEVRWVSRKKISYLPLWRWLLRV